MLAAQYSILIVGPLYRIHLKDIESLKEDNMSLPEKQAIEASKLLYDELSEGVIGLIDSATINDFVH